jgi:hypothetical protein
MDENITKGQQKSTKIESAPTRQQYRHWLMNSLTMI